MSVSPNDLHLGLIVASWHADLLSHGEGAFMATIAQSGTSVAVTRIEAPGALEFPLLAKRMAETGKYAAIAVLGFIVDGGIYRHEFVSQAVIDGLVRVSLDTGIPVLSAALTPQSYQETDTHEKFFADHLAIKGRELAGATLKVIRALRCIEGDSAACSAKQNIVV